MSYGPYTFGWPDELVDIHFPKRGLPKDVSLPWYYYLTQQTPTFFQYIGTQANPPGRGWQCTPNLPIIKILPIDTQKLTPTSQVGFSSIEEAVRRTNDGEPISQDAWGRFNFKNSFFWKVMGLKPPTWASFKTGLPFNPIKAQFPPVDQYIGNAVNDWRNRWNREADQFNSMTLRVDPNGGYGAYGPGLYALPVPGVGYSTFPAQKLQELAGQFYFGAIPPFVTFERGQALIFKQSFAFQYEIAQLDPAVWDMNVFPPQDATAVDYEKPPTAVSGLANGYNPNIAFPLGPPIIAGTK